MQELMVCSIPFNPLTLAIKECDKYFK